MKIAIIGAGASGLTAIKCCLEENLEPVCFEQEHFVGGLWRYTDDERHSSVYKSTVINTSKEMMCFSDYPIPASCPPFLHHSQVAKYLEDYVSAFGLHEYVRFGCRVIHVRQTASKKWMVVFSKVGRGNYVVFE